MQKLNVISSEFVADNIEKTLQKKMIYEDENTVLPGDNIYVPTVDISKDDAELNIINQTAKLKLKDEMKRMRALDDDVKIREYVIKTEYWNQLNQFYNRNGFEMSGQQKRNTRKQIERLYDKGKIKLTKQQKEDILYELNKPSNSNSVESKAYSKAANLADINSNILR